jgi:two-component system, response regulator
MSDFKRILLVEDDRRDIELTLEALSSHNLANEVVVVEDGAEAMDYLRLKGLYALRSPGNPAVILLDLKLPKLDGLEVLRLIRSDEALRLIPVVILTSSAEERDLVQSYRLGANGYVVKPLDFKEFVIAVASLGVFWAAINRPPPTQTCF